MDEQQSTVIQQIERSLDQLPPDKLMVVLDFVSFLLAQAQSQPAVANGVREGKAEYVVTKVGQNEGDVRPDVIAMIEQSMKDHAATWAELAKH